MIFNNIRLCLIRYRCLLYIDQKFSSLSSVQLNSIMKKLVFTGQDQKALDLFDQQLPICTDMTITLALKASTKLKDYQRGIRIHQQLSLKSLEDPFILTALIHFYMQCHQVDNAHRIFSTTKKKIIFMYGAMFKGYISNNMPEKVLELFENISIPVDEVIIILLFNACAKLSTAYAINLGKDVFNRLPNYFFENKKLINSAIDMFMKAGDVNEAERIFRQIKTKTVVTYGAMMQGYVTNNLPEKALDLFEESSLRVNEILYAILYNACASLCNERAIRLGKNICDQMPKMFLNNIVIITSLIHMIMKFGEVEQAESLFKQIKQPNLRVYGTLMNGYKINDQPHKCLACFEEIKNQNMTINEPIALSLIGACSQIGIRSISERIVKQISYLQYNLRLKNALIDMWGKSGDIIQAKHIFQSISQPDVFTYTIMINAYGRNGMGYEAIDLYEQIPKNFCDEVSAICVLNACSHAGLIDQARTIFNKICIKSEKIVTIMVDCLSRMEMFDDAQELVNDYEKSNSPSSIMYMTMLSGARNHRQVALSQKLFDRMNYLFPDNKADLIAASVLLSNIYSAVGDDQQAQDIRLNRLKQFGKNVKVGLTWTEVNGELVQFKAHDRSHPQSDEIYAELNRLSNELKEHGHKYDSHWITRPLKDEESVETVLCGHSEKLAIAFNFIQQRRPLCIQITNNLRICGDCHRATKMIAKIRQCQIIVRDANRIHHFDTNGQCSCQDHF